MNLRQRKKREKQQEKRKSRWRYLKRRYDFLLDDPDDMLILASMDPDEAAEWFRQEGLSLPEFYEMLAIDRELLRRANKKMTRHPPPTQIFERADFDSLLAHTVAQETP